MRVCTNRSPTVSRTPTAAPPAPLCFALVATTCSGRDYNALFMIDVLLLATHPAGLFV